MNIFLKRTAILLAAMTLATDVLAEPAEINFGIISTESSTNLKPKWEPFLAAMSQGTGLKINAFYASDYAGIIEGMKFGKVQVAWYGNKAAIEAADRAGAEVFAKTVSEDGTDGYYGLLLTQASNAKLNTVDDVLACDKSLNFGNGDPNSTSGYLVPAAFIFVPKGIDPKDCYKTVTNANHESNAMAVANGQVDFATNNTDSLTLIQKNNPDAFKKLKVIWKSPLIPSDPIAWRKDLEQSDKDKIMGFLMSYGRRGSVEDIKQARLILKDLGWSPFKPSSDTQLYPIRLLEITKAKGKITADATLSQADKDAQIKALDDKKRDIEQLIAETTDGLN